MTTISELFRNQSKTEWNLLIIPTVAARILAKWNSIKSIAFKTQLIESQMQLKIDFNHV